MQIRGTDILLDIVRSNTADDLLQETLDEEGAAGKKLTKLAETVTNVEAAAPVISP